MTLCLFQIRCCVLALIGATACFASSVGLTLDNTNNNPNSSLGSYGIGWLNFTVDSTGSSLLLMCDDDTHDINYGLNYIYNSSNLAVDLTNISSLEFGSLPSAVTDYKEAAYLAWEYNQVDPTGKNSTLSADYNIAIWTLFDPNPNGLAATTFEPAAGLTAADVAKNYLTPAYNFVTDSHNATFLQGIYANTEIYTPNPSLNNGNFSQEFIGELDPAPEPGTIWTALAGAVLVLLSRKIRSHRA